MKSLVNYINEAVEEYRLNDVEATYNVQPEEIILQAPDTFQESDIQQYMDDLWLEKLPSNADYSEKYFGKNNDNIYDAHFEYDTFEHIDVEPKEYIEWDSKYSPKTVNDDVTLEYFKIKNLRYIISFDRFDMIDVDDYNVKSNLVKIFKAAESSYENKWPIEIKFAENKLEYRK